MNQKSIISTLFLSFVFCTITAQSINNIKDIKTIKYHFSFAGKSLPRYIAIFITPTKITLEHTTRNGDDYSEEMSISTERWNSIINTIDIEKFNSLPETFDCKSTPKYCFNPDWLGGCGADTIFIEIGDGIKTKNIRFPTETITIPELDLFIKKIGVIQEEMKLIHFNK